MQKVVTSPSGMNLKKLLQCRVPPQGCRITNVPVTFMARTKDLFAGHCKPHGNGRWTQANLRSRERPPKGSTGGQPVPPKGSP